jgi:dipeptidyl aminopeptidase/acylaminoacyl peptidase
VAAPVADLQSHWGTSDTGSHVDAFDMQGDLWQVRDTYLRLSPIAAVERIRTPTLILQGEADLRCPTGQGEQLFQGMIRAGHTAAEMVLYPRGDHHFPEQGRPSHRVDYWQRFIAWLERWC